MSFDFSYRKLNVYQLSKELVRDVYSIISSFPKTENYALSDQIRRAVVSVPSNIVEGTARSSVKEQIHFMEIAFGSLMETMCQIAHDLDYITQEEMDKFEEKVVTVYKMLSAMQKSNINRLNCKP